ncbi:N-methyl-L-tryptophan oxidase [Microvirga sp. GCM10011540]|uniref:N-methyl-L-tryptophan oxidase n=1 Tax=Microvirga sp. GCM10011540 TaxID=3317338 RepID=UPI00360A48DF
MAGSVSTYDVAVIGLGAMGAAALYQLAKRGVRAIGIDRFAPPHDRGSTHGETRITRQAIGEGEVYVPLALRSHEIWRELEAETGERLLTQNGCLIIGSEALRAEGSVRVDFLARTLRAAQQYGIPHEVLDAAEIRRRFPQFKAHEGEIGYLEPGGGYLNPERCVAAQLARARALGATVRTGTAVVSIAQGGHGVRIATDHGEIEAGQAVVSAGSWAPALLGPPFDKLLAPTRQVMHWFPVQEDLASAWVGSPVFIWAHGSGASDFFYGFPSLPGSGTVKTAGEQYDETADPDRFERRVGPDEPRAMRDKHLAGRLEGLRPDAAKSITCLYTVTPDSNFLIDRHPDHDRILVVSPCSGHGFKHSAAIGEAVAQLMTTGGSAVDLSPFSLSRFVSVNAA